VRSIGDVANKIANKARRARCASTADRTTIDDRAAAKQSCEINPAQDVRRSIARPPHDQSHDAPWLYPSCRCEWSAARTPAAHRQSDTADGPAPAPQRLPAEHAVSELRSISSIERAKDDSWRATILGSLATPTILGGLLTTLGMAEGIDLRHEDEVKGWAERR
jgi:hypothetical protein